MSEPHDPESPEPARDAEPPPSERSVARQTPLALRVPLPARGALVHFAEIGLKGGNRHSFERRLGDRLREALHSAQVESKVVPLGGRFLAVPQDAARLDRVLTVLARVPGVASVAPTRLVVTEPVAVEHAALATLSESPAGSFKLEARRADKAFPLNSIELCRRVGAACVAGSGRRVDVHVPDVTVRLEVLHGCVLVSGAPRPGPGGLPVGSGGRLLAFLSGGLDSPVAAWSMLRRGARVTAVHFWNRSHEGPAVLEKLEDLCRVLAWAAGEMHLLVVPFEECQRAIVGAVPARVRMIVYRRAMLRIGAALAFGERALGFVTGDSLGQVASQTVENLRTIHAVARLPIYSPLVGSDKVEIVARARAIGTFDISIRPHVDCCSFLIAPHPETRSRPEEIAALEQALPWDDLVERAVAGTTRRSLRPDPAS